MADVYPLQLEAAQRAFGLIIRASDLNRDNVAFILLLSTMLLDEMFVCKERNISPEISTPIPAII